MRCHKAEKWFLRSFDGLLDEVRTAELEEHLRACPACSRMEKEYRTMLGILRSETKDEPLPYFWERLRSKFVRERKSFALLLWEHWCLKAIPVFLGVVLAFGAGLVFFAPPDQTPMTQSELLLMRDQAPMSDVQSIFEERQGEDRNMQFIFAAADEREPVRRPIP
jgi:predicted anti-sigma-YlaC factor YlaD